MVSVLSDDAVAQLLSLDDLLGVVSEAFEAQGRGAVERPDRPHFPVGIDGEHGGGDGGTGDSEPAGTALTMPAYIHGAETYATKLVSVHEDNAERGLPTVNAQIAVTDATTGEPLAYVHGTRITNARTGCIGGLAARDLASVPVDLGVVGAGTQARWQTRAIAAATDLRSVRVYSPSDSKHDCVADLRERLPSVDVQATDSPRAAVTDATVVVTATTATNPVFPGEALAPGTVVVAVGAYTAEMQELDSETFTRADQVFADVPGEVAEIGDVVETDVDADRLQPFSGVCAGDAGRSHEEEIIVVDSVGTAVLDAATADYVYRQAREQGVGETVTL